MPERPPTGEHLKAAMAYLALAAENLDVEFRNRREAGVETSAIWGHYQAVKAILDELEVIHA